MPCRPRDQVYDSEGNLLPEVASVSGEYDSYQECIDANCDSCSSNSDCSGDTVCCSDGANQTLCMDAGSDSCRIVNCGSEWLVLGSTNESYPTGSLVAGSSPVEVGKIICGSFRVSVVFIGSTPPGGFCGNRPTFDIKSCV
jgi:hypothetical protein